MEAALGSPRGGTHQARAERDVIVRRSLARLEQLEIGDQALSFGGIDYDEPLGRVCTFHIGRLAVSDEDMEPLVVDWRAPVAEPFYRATGRDPMGLRRRRHFAIEHNQLVSLEDELFDGELGEAGPEELPLSGPGALFAAVTRARTGRMADIVSTIQAQQDEIIRSPLSGILVVQGGPGTGKTAVALHRAAYLLYTHRMRLERQGVLVIAPSKIFAHYIDHVLPSLGETGVQITTVQGLSGFGNATMDETEAESLLKGDIRMERFIAKAVADRQRPMKNPVEIRLGAMVVILSRSDMSEAVRVTKRRGGSHNDRRRFIESFLAVRVAEKYLARRDMNAGEIGSAEVRSDEEFVNLFEAGAGNEAETKRKLARQVKRSSDFQRVMQRIWPRLTPETFLADLYSHYPLIRLAGKGLLTDEEMRLLHRPALAKNEVRGWTRSDLVILSEARVLVGNPQRRADGAEQERSFGHIIVDEAQDISPMEARMIGRYSLSGSMTLVGDVAQATSPFGMRSWAEIVAAMPKASSLRQVELKVNYRTPQEVMDIAGALLKSFSPVGQNTISIRQSGKKVELSLVEEKGLFPHICDLVAREMEVVQPGTVALIVPAEEKPSYLRELNSAGLPASGFPDTALSVLSINEAKGLEFDSVLISGANRLLSTRSLSLQALYVAMTRTTNRLVFVHNRDVPDVIVDLLLNQGTDNGKEKLNNYYSANRG